MANTSIGAKALLELVKLKRTEVVTLLLKYGVVVNSGASDLEIAMKVTDLSKTSKSFYKELMKMLLDPVVVTNVYAGMDGYSNTTGIVNDFGNLDIPGVTTSPKPTATSSGSSWLADGLNLLQTGFNGYLQLDSNKTKRALADASVQVVQAGGTVNTTTPPPPTSNTALYVVLGVVGVSVLGLLVYLVAKKK